MTGEAQAPRGGAGGGGTALRDLLRRLSLPVIGSPLFIISGPDLVVAQCAAGIVGSLPSLNARPAAQLADWLAEIRERLDAHDARHPDRPAAPFAVNLVVHRSNDRLEHDLALCARFRVPLIITSLGARPDVNEAVHAYGGLVLHDVVNQTFARKAVEKGADGLVLVAAGAGGHAGSLSPFALVQETRAWFDGAIALSGAIATGRAILAAQVMGADVAYIGSPFIATDEARAAEAHKAMIVAGTAGDIVSSDLFTGVRGNYLRASIVRAGLDPDALPPADPARIDFSADRVKPWKDIWGSGQGIGAVRRVEGAAALVARLRAEYAAALDDAARRRSAAGPAGRSEAAPARESDAAAIDG